MQRQVSILIITLLLTNCTKVESYYNQVTHKEMTNIKPAGKKMAAKGKTDFLTTPDQCKTTTNLIFEKSALKTALSLSNKRNPLLRLEQKAPTSKNKRRLVPTTNLTLEFDLYAAEKHQFIEAVEKNLNAPKEKNVVICLSNVKTLAKNTAATEIAAKAQDIRFYSK